MRSTRILLLSLALASLCPAQRTLESLRRDFQAKQREAMQKGAASMAAQKQLIQEQITAVEEFLKKEAKGVDRFNGRLFLADLNLGLGAKDKAQEALLSLDEKEAPAHVLTRAAMLASRLGMKDERGRWIDAAVAKSQSFDERIAVAKDLFTLLQEIERGQAILDKALEEAGDDEQKAKVLWFQADITRGREDLEEGAYPKALDELAKRFPKTYYGSVAKDQLAAMQLQVGGQPIAFATQDADGKPVALADYAGKVLVLSFWAAWVPPCRESEARLLALYEKHKAQGLEVLGVSLDPDCAAMRRACADWKTTWRQVCDGQGPRAEIALRWNVPQVPCMIVLDRDGKIAALNLDPTHADGAKELERTIAAALERGK